VILDGLHRLRPEMYHAHRRRPKHAHKAAIVLAQAARRSIRQMDFKTPA
jgi:hypothetical protein